MKLPLYEPVAGLDGLSSSVPLVYKSRGWGVVVTSYRYGKGNFLQLSNMPGLQIETCYISMCGKLRKINI